MEPSTLPKLVAAIGAVSGSGFFLHQDRPAKKYFFYWANSQKQVLLVSKIYQTVKSCKQAMAQAQQGRYTLKPTQDNTHWGLQMANTNGQVIAISPPFDQASERDQTLAELQQSVQAVAAPAKKPAAPKASIPKASAPKASTPIASTPIASAPTASASTKFLPTVGPTDSSSSDRHSFRLVYYRSGEQKSWQGVLTHSLSGEKIVLKGTETSEIRPFVAQFLSGKKNQLPGENIPTPTDGLELEWQNVGETQRIGALVGIKVMTKKTLYNKRVEASLFSKSLIDGSKTLIGRSQGYVAPEQALQLKAMTNDLNPGMYRLTVTIDDAEQPIPDHLLEDSRLLLLV